MGYQLDAFNKYKGTFICYNSAMDPVQVDAYCCNMDILPTLMNLFGFEYDSRLVMGTDVLSDSMHIAVLQTRAPDGRCLVQLHDRRRHLAER